MPPQRMRKQLQEDAALQSALVDLQSQAKNGLKVNIKATAAKYGAKYGTLRNRFQGNTLPPRLAHESQQYITPQCEKALVEWLLHLSTTSRPVCRRQIKTWLNTICPEKGKPSRRWIYRFLKRHPEIKFGKPAGLDPKRASAFNEPVVKEFLELNKHLQETYKVKPKNLYNMDEKGCQRGGGRKNSGRKYIIPSSQRPAYKLRSGNLELITIIECISADGSGLQPGFVFPGKGNFCPEWFADDLPGEIGVSTSDNGWTDDFLGTEWFEQTFVPQATERRDDPDDVIILILDGHGSHESSKMIDIARENNIHILELPPHTTHRLQPLDVGVFGPFQRAWIERCDEVVEDTGEEIPVKDFIKEYLAVRKATFKPETIQAAWRKSGCYPINLDIFSALDYAPSVPFSRSRPLLPPSYPTLNSILAQNVTGLDWDIESESEHGSNSSSDAESDGSDDDEPHQHQIQVPTSPPPVASPVPSFPLAPPVQSFTTPPQAPPHHPDPPPPTLVSTPQVVSPPRWHAPGAQTRLKRNSNLENRVDRLEAEVKQLSGYVDTLKAHNAICGRELLQLQRKVNSKAAPTRRKVRVNARYLTGDVGREEVRAAEQAREEKARQKEAAKQRRKQKDDDRVVSRANRDPNEPFKGPLSSKNKSDLQDIALALGISEAGTKTNLLDRILNYFDSNPSHRSFPKFEGLFTRTRAARNQPGIENISPQAGPSTQPPPPSHPGHPRHFYPSLTTTALMPYNYASPSTLPFAPQSLPPNLYEFAQPYPTTYNHHSGV